MSCMDGNTFLTSLHWSAWTESGASGVGDVVANNCIPDCASGKWVHNPVLVNLSFPAIGPHRIKYFTNMTLSGPSIFSYSYTLASDGAELLG
jgi:hypothetical protein